MKHCTVAENVLNTFIRKTDEIRSTRVARSQPRRECFPITFIVPSCSSMSLSATVFSHRNSDNDEKKSNRRAHLTGYTLSWYALRITRCYALLSPPSDTTRRDADEGARAASWIAVSPSHKQVLWPTNTTSDVMQGKGTGSRMFDSCAGLSLQGHEHSKHVHPV